MNRLQHSQTLLDLSARYLAKHQQFLMALKRNAPTQTVYCLQDEMQELYNHFSQFRATRKKPASAAQAY